MFGEIKDTDLVKADDFGEDERINALVSPYLEDGEHILWYGGKDEWRSRSSAEKRTTFFKVMKIASELLFVLLLVLIFLVTVIFAIIAVIMIVLFFVELVQREIKAKKGLYVVTDKSIMIMTRQNTIKIPYSHVSDVMSEKFGKKAGRLSVLYADRNIMGDLAAKTPFKTIILNKIEAPDNVQCIILEALNNYRKAEGLQGR
ncbi:hypothetical protein [Ruminococcus sp.]|uniref:hypothetical protein n=1 Tax=Ruminococcus sp. TaxID=41978 RepID=UPI0025EC6E51|nr:hypothetical protein [Ruminococcus sp.]MCR4640258.1 hypothetical protein [Ruminococcus sp.]